MSPQRNKRRASPAGPADAADPARATQLELLRALQRQYARRSATSRPAPHALADAALASELGRRAQLHQFCRALEASSKGAVKLPVSDSGSGERLSVLLPAFRDPKRKGTAKSCKWLVGVVEPLLAAVEASAGAYTGPIPVAEGNAGAGATGSPRRQTSLVHAFAAAAAADGSPTKKARGGGDFLRAAKPWYLRDEYASGTARVVNGRNRSFSTLGITGSVGISGTLTMGSWKPVLDALAEIGCRPGADLLELGAGVGQSSFAYLASMETLRGALPREVLAIELCPDRCMVLQANWRQVLKTPKLEHWRDVRFFAKQADLGEFDFGRRPAADGGRAAGPYGSDGAVCFAFDKGIPFDDRTNIYTRLLRAKWGFLVCNSPVQDFADQGIPLEHHKTVVMSQFGSGQQHSFNIYRRV